MLGLSGAVVFVLAGCSSSSGTASSTTAPAKLSPSAVVLDAAYARSIGFPKTLQAAKQSTVTGQKGCSESVEAVYENTGSKTGLISDVLNCGSKASATTALATARKAVKVDTSLTVPKELGPTGFATSSHAPEYLMVWQAGNRVAITAIDVDITASSSSSTRQSPALSPSQGTTLGNAAVRQNSLYQ